MGGLLWWEYASRRVIFRRRKENSAVRSVGGEVSRR
jgi:hypothetical protein